PPKSHRAACRRPAARPPICQPYCKRCMSWVHHMADDASTCTKTLTLGLLATIPAEPLAPPPRRQLNRDDKLANLTRARRAKRANSAVSPALHVGLASDRLACSGQGLVRGGKN